jgi:CMP-2-keto-3-deoxyoctulosonic acid synthetase
MPFLLFIFVIFMFNTNSSNFFSTISRYNLNIYLWDQNKQTNKQTNKQKTNKQTHTHARAHTRTHARTHTHTQLNAKTFDLLLHVGIYGYHEALVTIQMPFLYISVILSYML